MGMKIEFNFRKIEAKILQTGERAVKGMSAVMRKRAVLIRDLARSYAPVQSGLLERNIDYVTLKDANRRNTYLVYIDTDAAAGRRHGTLGDYAAVMERRLRPYGSGGFQLGKLSRAKAAGGAAVGGRFFKRAVEQGTKLLREEMQAAARGKTFASVAPEVTRAKFRPVAQMGLSRGRKRKNRKNS